MSKNEKKMTIEEMEKIINEHSRIIGDDEIVIKKSVFEAKEEKAFLEWREEYDQNCLLRLRVSELEKELEKAKQEAREIFAFIDELMNVFCDDDDQISLKVCEYKASTRNFAREKYGIELE